MRRGPLLALLLLIAPATARAGSEEFSTFDVIAQEEDDESLLDHLLTRAPDAWRDEWERSPKALRSAQGCLTSGQWFVDTELKAGAPVAEGAAFGIEVRDRQSDRAAYTYFDFSFRFRTRFGTPGFWFRPLFDKSRQDLGLFWEAGAETAAAYARLTFGFEDVFNNLWEFRQSRVGEASEPYEKHPFEPALRVHLRRAHWRVALDGQYLTPSRKRFGTDTLARHTTLWGAWGRALIEAKALGTTWSVSGENRQARSSEPYTGAPVTLDLLDFRRQWAVEATASRPIGALWEVDLRWIYQGRDQVVAGDGRLYYPEVRLDVVERVSQLEARRRFGERWAVRIGAMVDRITVAAADGSGNPTPVAFATYGSRTESRAYLGASARFGRVSLSAVEGIELDPESYEVWGVHDKAFVQLQTTF